MSVIRNALLKRYNNFNLNKFLTLAVRNLSDDNHPNILRSGSEDIVIPEVTIPEFFYSHIGPYSGLTAIVSYFYTNFMNTCFQNYESLPESTSFNLPDVDKYSSTLV